MQRSLQAAVEPLVFARTKALELRMLAAAVESSARLLYVYGVRDPSIAALERDIAYALPLCASHECDHFARPLLLNNVGVVYLASGRREEARQYFVRAKADLGDYSDADLELTIIDRNLAMLTPDPTQRLALADGVWRRLRDALGEQHPTTIDALLAYAEYVPDPATAYDLTRQAADAYHRFHPTLVEAVATADAARAFLAGELGDAPRALADYATAVAATDSSSDPDIAILNDALVGELALLRGSVEDSIIPLTSVRDKRLPSRRWYEREEGLRAEVWLGLAQIARRQDAEAARHLEVALAEYPDIIAINEQVRYRRTYARAQRALGLLLRRSGGDPARAATLEQEANAFYQSSGPGYGWAIDADRAK